ncbi:efflux transporter periplasmic adaptor subunit, partial [Pseudomonas sp. FW215-T2]
MMLVGIKAPMTVMPGRMGLIPLATAIVAQAACSSKAPPPPPMPQVSVALPLK